MKKSVKRILKVWKKCLLVMGLVSACALVGCVNHKPPVAKTTQVEQPAPNLAQEITRLGGQVIHLGETIRIVLPSDLLFLPHSSNLINEQSMPILDLVAQFIQSFQTTDVNIGAYTDDTSIDSSMEKRNLLLSNNQAKVVESYLWSGTSYGGGMNTRLSHAQGYGNTNNVSSNLTSSGRKDNSRIEISFRYFPRQKSYN